jgi:SpoVK/Ycf46/Vps4 family AAA+-type ATPase
MERARAYQNRIKATASGIPDSPYTQNVQTIKTSQQHKPDTNISNMRKEENETENLGAEFDGLVMKDKPNVSWDQVIGLDDAIRAIRESIVYPTKRMDLFLLGWPRGILLYGPPGCGETFIGCCCGSGDRRLFH